jgi:predicted N-formylglutamate amidohydrolase
VSHAYEVLNPDGRAPALLVCDHASRAIPPHLARLGLAEAFTFEHMAWDIGAGPVACGLAAALDAPAVLAGWSRLVVDCNRRLDDPTAFLAISDGVPVPGNANLGEAERRWRIAHCYEPYHRAIEQQLLHRQQRGVHPALLAVHSFTPSLRDQAGERPWHVGILWDKDERLARPMIERLRQLPGIVVGDNEPYSGRHPGDYTIDHHAEARGLAHVGIEIRQDLISDEAGVATWVGILAATLRPLLADPAGFSLRSEI